MNKVTQMYLRYATSRAVIVQYPRTKMNGEGTSLA